MKEAVADKSSQQGLPRSRLPEFTEEEKQRILGEVPFESAHQIIECLFPIAKHIFRSFKLYITLRMEQKSKLFSRTKVYFSRLLSFLACFISRSNH